MRVSMKRSGAKRKARRELTDEERVKIALARYSPLREGKAPRKTKELQEIYHRDPSVISKAVVEAFRKGLVEIREVDQPQRPERIEELEQKLVSCFDLRTAVVISPATGVGSKLDPAAAADELHRRLGQALASFVSSSAVFRDGDIIGLGSGRGVFYTVEALRDFLPLRAVNVRLVSLTGALFAQDHAKKMNLRLDADIHVNLFGERFAHPIEVHELHAPIVPSDEKELLAIRKRTWLGGERRYGFAFPTHSLVGVGVLSRGHKLFEAVTSTNGILDYILKPIHPWLKSLVTICAELSSARYCPVADISNNLFYVKPPMDIPVSDAKERQIKKLIENINRKLLNIDDAQLQRVVTIIVVAGGLQKACALRQLLNDERYKIRVLCTDRETAQEILA